MEKRQRRKRDQRDPNPPPMLLTERDKAIIAAVYEYRALRQDQLQALFFGSQTAAQRRLALLYHHGFLERQFLLARGGIMNSPILYLLDRRGEELLRAEYGADEVQWKSGDNKVGGDFLEHTLSINDFRIAVTLACHQLGYAVLEWRSEAQLKQEYDRVTLRTPTGRSRTVAVVPDSFFALQTPYGRTHFFLELDRGTMTTKRFQTKVEAYLVYYRSGGYQKRYGARSLRVLTVTLGERRLESLKAVTEQAGGQAWFWFGVLPELSAERALNAPVWSVAGREGRFSLIGPV
jgi:hypothetical protein